MQAYATRSGTGGDMDRKRVGHLVRGRRTALRLSLRQAAALTDGAVSFSSWQQVEAGSLNWTSDLLAHILYALDSHMDVQLRAGQFGAPPDVEQADLVDRLASIVDRLPESAVRSLTAQIQVYEETLGIQGQSSR